MNILYFKRFTVLCSAERQVWNLAPFTSKDFAIRGLADRVKDLQSLVYLYPDMPKAQAFAKYYSPASGKFYSSF